MFKFLKLILLFFASTFVVFSDTIVLKNGKRMTVDVLEKNEDSYLVLYYFSDSIKYEKEIPVADIDRIESGDNKDKERYREIKQFFPIPDGKSSAYYSTLLEKYINPFLEDYPESAYTFHVKDYKDQVNEERAEIELGGIKYKGAFLSKQEIATIQYDYNANQLADDVEANLKAKRPLGALREYESLRSGYSASKAFRSTAPIVANALSDYKVLLIQKIASPEMAPTDEFLAALEINEANRIKEEYDSKMSLIKKKIALETAQGQIWKTVDFSNKPSMQTSLTLVNSRLNEIEKLGESEFIDAGDVYTKLFRSLKSSDLEASEAALQEFKGLKPAEELVIDLNSKVEMLKLEEEEAKLVADEAEKAKEKDEATTSLIKVHDDEDEVENAVEVRKGQVKKLVDGINKVVDPLTKDSE